MRTVYKYPLEFCDVQEIAMPEGAQSLCAQVQNEKPQLWALVDPSRPMARREILVLGTGHPIDVSPLRYISTFQVRGGSLVFHVFEATGLMGMP